MNDIIIVGEYNLVTQYQLDNLMLLEKEIRMTPFIKWAGGKRQLLGRINELLPNSFNNYYEPFIGGGAVLFNIRPTNSFINDINKALINTYIQIRDNHIELINLLKVLDKKVALYQKEFYYEARIEYNKLLKNNIYSVETAAYFIFLNKHGFNGLYRVNKKGEFNVPYGRYKNFNTNLITNKHYELLKNTEIYNLDYAKIFEMATPNDIMFLDPPYDCVFNDYGNDDGFNEEDQRRLAEEYKNLNTRALMIVAKTPLTEELYSKFIVEEYDKNYAVNIRNRFKSEAKHIIIKNY